MEVGVFLKCTRMAAVVIVVLAFFGFRPGSSLAAANYANVFLGEDAAFVAFTGASNPLPSGYINIVGGNPGYLNGISGGQFGGARGSVGIIDPYENDVELVGLAITVTDYAGNAHSLSDLDDPALADIVNDLNASSAYYNIGITAYAYSAAPKQYVNQLAALSAGESVNNGQPFDILLISANQFSLPHSFLNWSFDFSNEIGNPDGITALSITDIGALPEPAAADLVLLGSAILLGRRHRPRHHVGQV